MGELEGIADELVVIGRGRLIAQTSVEELLASRSDGRVHVRTPQLTEVMAALAGAGGTVTSTGADALVVTGLQPERIAALVSEHGLRLDELYRGRATLEDAFIDLTRDAIDYVAERPGRQR